MQKNWQQNGLAILRIISGLLMVFHGWEIFDKNKIDEYLKWDVIRALPAPVFMVYMGKLFELLSGLCFIFGVFVRPAAIFMTITMLFICFMVGKGRFWYEDQHPFLFALLALIFFFAGYVKWGLAELFTKKDIR